MTEKHVDDMSLEELIAALPEDPNAEPLLSQRGKAPRDERLAAGKDSEVLSGADAAQAEYTIMMSQYEAMVREYEAMEAAERAEQKDASHGT